MIECVDLLSVLFKIRPLCKHAVAIASSRSKEGEAGDRARRAHQAPPPEISREMSSMPILASPSWKGLSPVKNSMQ